MNYMILFLVACVILGLWSSPKAKRSWIVAVLAIGMIVFFLISPRHM